MHRSGAVSLLKQGRERPRSLCWFLLGCSFLEPNHQAVKKQKDYTDRPHLGAVATAPVKMSAYSQYQPPDRLPSNPSGDSSPPAFELAHKTWNRDELAL